MFIHVGEKWYVQSKATEILKFRAKIPVLMALPALRVAW